VEGAEAFLTRLQGRFDRKLSHRPEKLELRWGIQSLGEAASATDALERAEKALGGRRVAGRVARR
jgi:hypothetical protein